MDSHDPTDKKDSVFTKHRTLPLTGRIHDAVNHFSLTETIFFYVFAAIFIATGLFLLWKVNQAISVEVPAHAGSLTEGVIGSPRFINPLLAQSDTDRDLTELVYSGLLKEQSDGSFMPDLAESYSVSEDGLVYSFTLRSDALWSDGTPVTADDVLFTIQMAEDPALKSPKRPNWDGVKAEKVDDTHLTLTLRQAYGPFIGNLTLGILPKHLWKEVSAEEFPFTTFNTEPIGSGPYRISKVRTNSGGLPVSYELIAFKDHVDGEAYISNLTLSFYSNEEALFNAYQNGEIEAVSAVSPEKVRMLATSGTDVNETSSSRIFGVFFNQNQAPILAHKEVRKALNDALDKDAIVAEVLGGYGQSVSEPVPPGTIRIPAATSTEEVPALHGDERIKQAQDALLKKGWEIDPQTKNLVLKTTKDKKTTTETLAISLSTSNAPELKHAAELVKAAWQKLGVKVTVKIFEQGDLNQNVIRPRKYDALLFGEIIGHDLDLYAFWHSSQRLDPGLNIALYANSKADKLLEKMRNEPDEAAATADYLDFQKEIDADVPAVFLYSPNFLYLLPKKVQGVGLPQITVSSERFIGIADWYIETDRVWKFLIRDTKSN